MWYEPYCGRDTHVDDLGLGQGPNTVLQLAKNASLVPGEELFFDNLFTSFDLLENLSERGLGGTGTVRQNRLNRVPIVKKKDLEKKTVERGTTQAIFNEDQVLAVWKDNKAVYIASNKYGMEPFSTCDRFNRIERKSIQVPVPACIKKYNAGMGGVDLLDNLVACYRIIYRVKKWWFPLYTWSLSVSAVNAWRLRQAIRGEREPYLDFLRELCTEMFEVHGSPPAKRNPLPVNDNIRFDEHNHLIVGIYDEAGKPHRKNCKQCYATTKQRLKSVYQCEKCAVPLHVHCFKEGLILSTNSKEFWAKILFYWFNFIFDFIWAQFDACKKICVIHSFLYSFTYLFILAFIHLFIYFFFHLFILSFIYLFTYSFVYLFIHTCIHSFIHSFVCSFIDTSIHAFISALIKS